MFKWRTPRERTGLEKARDEALSELHGFTAETTEYQKIVAHVKTLTKLIAKEKSEKLSPNTIAMISGNVIIALLVVGYESKNVVTSKVLPFLNKTR